MLLKSVQSDSEIDLVCRLAEEIWHEHYSSIITPQQISYMLHTFQSGQAIKAQCEGGFAYFLIFTDEKPIGYLSVIAKPVERNLFLSKYYLLKNMRGQGFGRKVMNKLECLAVEQHLESIYLTVNRQNTSAITVYQKMGFHIVGPCISEIGNGYIMDDYKMLKKLPFSS